MLCYVWEKFCINCGFKDNKDLYDLFFLLSYSAGKRYSNEKIFLCLTEILVNWRPDFWLVGKLSAHMNWTFLLVKIRTMVESHWNYFPALADNFSHMNSPSDWNFMSNHSQEFFKICVLGPILESVGMHVIFQKKGKKILKRGKKGQYIWKFWQKFAKLENILKKGRWLRSIAACNKLLE